MKIKNYFPNNCDSSKKESNLFRRYLKRRQLLAGGADVNSVRVRLVLFGRVLHDNSLA